MHPDKAMRMGTRVAAPADRTGLPPRLPDINAKPPQTYDLTPRLSRKGSYPEGPQGGAEWILPVSGFLGCAVSTDCDDLTVDADSRLPDGSPLAAAYTESRVGP